MDSTDLSILKTSIKWLEAGRRIVLATVVHAWGSAPRPIGAWLVWELNKVGNNKIKMVTMPQRDFH